MSRATATYTTPQMLLVIQALSPGASVNYSQYTQKWYVEARNLDVGDGVMLTGSTEHAATPEEAVRGYFDYLTSVEYPKYIVSSYQGHRREWRWNGAAFAEVTRDLVLEGQARAAGDGVPA